VEGGDNPDSGFEEGGEREVEGDGAEGIEDEEDDRHHAGVRVAFAVEDYEGIGIGAFLECGVLILLRGEDEE